MTWKHAWQISEIEIFDYFMTINDAHNPSKLQTSHVTMFDFSISRNVVPITTCIETALFWITVYFCTSNMQWDPDIQLSCKLEYATIFFDYFLRSEITVRFAHTCLSIDQFPTVSNCSFWVKLS